MGKARKHNPAKLIIGFIFREEPAFDKAKSVLKKRFGTIDFERRALPFTHTDYYEKEFGGGLKRKFISFRKLICPCNLTKIKLITNKLEHKLSMVRLRSPLTLSEVEGSRGKFRLINIDPGYLDLAKLILASTKDYKHRVYLNQGIYAEVTLFYENKSFRPWQWTYPDYRTDEYIEIFNRIRDIYAQQLTRILADKRTDVHG